jgi:hypothetical protein
MLKIPATEATPLSLYFDGSIPADVRPRILYAFRVFAAIYGYRVIEADSAGDSLRCYYGGSAIGGRNSDVVHIPARYTMPAANKQANAPVEHYHAGERFHLFFGLDKNTCRPDWPGEIFAWLSGSYEAESTTRDTVGRVPFSETIFGRFARESAVSGARHGTLCACLARY